MVAGFGAGLLLQWRGPGAAQPIADAVEPLGTLWCDALRLFVYPLVAFLLLLAIATPVSSRSTSRMAWIAFATFLGLLLVGAALALLLTPPSMVLLGVERGGFRAGAPAPAPPGGGGWLTPLFGGGFATAFARGDLLAILLVSCMFALAVRRLPEDRRRTLVDFFRASLEALLVILGWFMALAPLAIFALSLGMGVRSGASGVGAFAAFVAIVVVELLALTLLVYPIAAGLGGLSILRFARAALPPQGVAMGTRSSIASLPALLDAGRRLGLAPEVSGFVFPLCVAVFKANRTVSGTVKLLFLAHVFGVPLDPGAIGAYVLTLVAISFAAPGTPSGGAFVSAPALLAAGVPMEGVAMAYAVDTLPDIFKTLANVTSDLAAAVIVARFRQAD